MLQPHPIRILSYCVLSNHSHIVVWPEEDGQLMFFFRRLRRRTQRAGECRTGPRIQTPIASIGHALSRSPMLIGLAEAEIIGAPARRDRRIGPKDSRTEGDRRADAAAALPSHRTWRRPTSNKLPGDKKIWRAQARL